MPKKETPLKEAPEEVQDDGSATAAENEEGQSEEHQRLKEAYERAKEELKTTADRLKSEIDQIDTEKIKKSTTDWIRENPGLSFAMAIGVGILAGKALSSLAKEEPPPTFRDRLRQRTGDIAESARHAAGHAADRLSEQAREKGELLASRVQTAKGTLNSNADAMGTLLADQANQLSTNANAKTNQILSSFSEAAERAADSLHVAAKDLSKSAKKYKKYNAKAVNSLVHAAKTIFSAYVFKKLSDWIRDRG